MNEKRIIKVNFNKNGNGYFINRVAIPPKGISHLVLTETDIESVVYYQGIIEKAEEINKYLESVYGPD